MHYALLLTIMRYHGLGSLLDRPQTGPSFRKLLYKTLLATDMSVHCDFMEAFRSMGAGEEVDSSKRQVLVCQALIKCADISNPVGVVYPTNLPFIHARFLRAARIKSLKNGQLL